MKPQDVVVLLKRITPRGRLMQQKDLAASLSLSAAEVSESIERCRNAKLVDESKQHVNVLALKEFLVHGLKYVFPVEIGNIARGIPTALSASPIKEQISSGKESFVWEHKNGTIRGQKIEPLYHTVPDASMNDDKLYQLLVIMEVLRMGRVREREIAIRELDKYLDAYGREQD